MKIKQLLLAFFVFMGSFTINAQIIPNDNFTNGITGWTFTATGVTLAQGTCMDPNTVNLLNNTAIDRNFTFKSSNFALFANNSYLFDIRYGHFTASGMGGPAFMINTLTSIELKNSAGTVIQTLSPTQIDNHFAGPCGRVSYNQNITVPTTDTYYIELKGIVTSNTTNNPKSYNIAYVKLSENVAKHTINGNIKLNESADNCATSTRNLGNILVKHQIVGDTNSYYSATNSFGNYSQQFINSGNLQSQVVSTDGSATPTSYTNLFNPGYQIENNQNFCFTATNSDDVEVYSIPLLDARPGFKARYRIFYSNKGSNTKNGSLTYNFEGTKMSLFVANPTATSSTSTSLTWSFTNLLPFEIRYIDVTFSIAIPPTVNSGDSLVFTATVNAGTDINLTNNTATLAQTVVNSYDPNDVTCLQGNFITAAQATNYLYYVIRFQNTGTASAVNINVTNEMDNFLDWNSIVPLAASNSYELSVNNSNILNFKFANINLPSSITDEPGSHGWVLYKIKPKSSFGVGNVIQNTAKIYFDYNAPIITNTYPTQISTVLATNEKRNQEISIYPNPAKDKIFIKNVKNITGIKIYDSTGKVVRSNKTNSDLVNVSNLPKGIYFMEIVSKNKFFKTKFIKD